MGAARDKHPKKDLEKLLRDVEDREWRVERTKGYYRCKCPCGAHQRSVHLSPSDPNYEKNARAWFTRQPCWKEDA